jgi:hypothetical protein
MPEPTGRASEPRDGLREGEDQRPGGRAGAIALVTLGTVVAGFGEVAAFMSMPVGLAVVLLGLGLAARGLGRL